LGDKDSPFVQPNIGNDNKSIANTPLPDVAYTVFFVMKTGANFVGTNAMNTYYRELCKRWGITTANDDNEWLKFINEHLESKDEKGVITIYKYDGQNNLQPWLCSTARRFSYKKTPVPKSHYLMLSGLQGRYRKQPDLQRVPLPPDIDANYLTPLEILIEEENRIELEKSTFGLLENCPLEVRAKVLERAIDSLPQKEQAVYNLYHIEQISNYAEIGRIVRCDRGTVQRRLKRSYRKMEMFIEKYLRDNSEIIQCELSEPNKN